MEYKTFGDTGIQVSALGFGCGDVGGLMVRGTVQERLDAVARALDAGITHVIMHGAQHCAEAAEILTRLGYSPGQLDYMEFLDLRELDLPFYRPS